MSKFIMFFRLYRGQTSQIAGDSILNEDDDVLLLEDGSLLLLER